MKWIPHAIASSSLIAAAQAQSSSNPAGIQWTLHHPAGPAVLTYLAHHENLPRGSTEASTSSLLLADRGPKWLFGQAPVGREAVGGWARVRGGSGGVRGGPGAWGRGPWELERGREGVLEGSWEWAGQPLEPANLEDRAAGWARGGSGLGRRPGGVTRAGWAHVGAGRRQGQRLRGELGGA